MWQKVSLFWVVFLWLMVSCRTIDPGADDVYRFYESVNIDGETRTYLLNLPPDFYENSDRYPLVIALHGTGGEATQFENNYHFTEKANSAGFVVVYPEGIKNHGFLGVRVWNAGDCCGDAADRQVDDKKFITTLIDEFVSEYRIDPQKVYATGMSNGGMMTYRLACEMSEKIAAVAVVSGTLVSGEPCTPGSPVPVLHIHSILDDVVPYHGGEGLGGYYFPPVDSVLTIWASINGCSTNPEISDHEKYSFYEWPSCKNGSAVELYLTKGGGHSWPGGEKPRPQADPPSTAIDANDLIWDFFQLH